MHTNSCTKGHRECIATPKKKETVDPILTKIVKTIENEFFSHFFEALLEEKHTIPFNRLTHSFPVFLGRGESDISPYPGILILDIWALYG